MEDNSQPKNDAKDLKLIVNLVKLKQTPFPEEIQTLVEDGIRQFWHDVNLRECGYSRAREIVRYAKTSVRMERWSKRDVKCFHRKDA